MFKSIKKEFDEGTLENLSKIILKKEALNQFISNEIEKEIKRAKEKGSSPKNSTLYFSLILECKDIFEATITMLEHYYIEYQKSKDSTIL